MIKSPAFRKRATKLAAFCRISDSEGVLLVPALRRNSKIRRVLQGRASLRRFEQEPRLQGVHRAFAA